MAKKPHSDPRTKGFQSGGKSSAGGVSTSVTDSLRRGAMGDSVLDVLQSTSVNFINMIFICCAGLPTSLIFMSVDHLLSEA